MISEHVVGNFSEKEGTGRHHFPPLSPSTNTDPPRRVGTAQTFIALVQDSRQILLKVHTCHQLSNCYPEPCLATAQHPATCPLPHRAQLPATIAVEAIQHRPSGPTQTLLIMPPCSQVPQGACALRAAPPGSTNTTER